MVGFGAGDGGKSSVGAIVGSSVTVVEHNEWSKLFLSDVCCRWNNKPPPHHLLSADGAGIGL
jgi:hypothetical protein